MDIEVSASESSSDNREDVLKIQCAQRALTKKKKVESKDATTEKEKKNNYRAEKEKFGARRMGLSNYRIPKKDINKLVKPTKRTEASNFEETCDEDHNKIIKLIANSLASQFYHDDKNNEYSTAERNKRYPLFLLPKIEIKYKNDISSEISLEMMKAKETFAKTMCGLLAKHHKAMSEAQQECTKGLKSMAEKRFTNNSDKIYKMAEKMAMDKHIKYRFTREGPTSGAKRPRE